LKDATEGGNAGGLWSMSGLLADEWKSGDTFIQRVETDQRIIQNNNVEIIDEYRAQHRARQSAREALDLLRVWLPTTGVPAATALINATYQGQMFWVMGHAELNLAENWCSGIPFGEIVNALPVYSAPLTRAEMLAKAMLKVDSGIALITGVDTMSVGVLRNLRMTKARILVNQGDFAGAAALMTAANVPTNYRYRQSHSLTTFDVAAWSLNNSQKRWVLGDSFDLSGRIANAIPYASIGFNTTQNPTGDPRIPVTGKTSTNVAASGGAGRAFDNSTNFVQQNIWGRSDQLPIYSGIDARLIEAEYQLQLGNIGTGATQMTGILNTLRGTAQELSSSYSTPVMAALPAPATQAAAAALFFREKALWQFGRGYRLPDLRRMILQYAGAPYNYTQANVYPTGTFFKTGLPYGTHVVFPLTTDETSANLLATSCDASIP
jgi:hypothetical protein